MSKRRHVIALAVWAALLVVAVVISWGRLFPRDGKTGTPATGAPGAGAGALRPAPAPPAGRDAKSQFVGIHQALRAKNPDYNGRGQFRMAAGKITVADVSRAGIADPSPLKEFPLEALDLSENPISDLTPLRGTSLKRLALEATKVTDLTPLQGMKLTGLYLNRTRVKDLSPLQGMQLELLNLYETEVDDLTPLRGMPLKFLWLNGTKVADLTPVARCPLVSLTLHKTPVSDLAPLSGSRTLQRLHIADTPVTDLTPLKGMSLQRLVFTPGRVTKGLGAVRDMKSIREIGTTLEGLMPPDRFWLLHDQGEFK